MIRRTVLGGESGFTALQIVIAMVVLGILITLSMPSLQGYQQSSQVRQAAVSAVSEMRQAQNFSMLQNQEIYVLYDPSGDLPSRGWKQGWEYCLPTAACTFSSTWTSDPALLRYVVPNYVDMYAACYRGAYLANGSYLYWGQMCGANPGPSVEAMCFDTGGSHPAKIMVTIVYATGTTTMSNWASGQCP